MGRFRNILCVFENGVARRPALERAVKLAEGHQARLTVVDVVPRLPTVRARMRDGGASDLQAEIVGGHDAQLASLLGPYSQRLEIAHRVLTGTSFLEVIREVLRVGHDLVIKCPESPKWLDRALPGDDMHLLRKCPCPVWLVKSQAPENYRHVLAAVDVDDVYPPLELETRRLLNFSVLDTAASLAISESAELHVVHAWESISEVVSGLAFSSGIAGESLRDELENERLQQQRLVDSCIAEFMAESSSARDALDYLRPAIHLLKGSARQEIPVLANRLSIDCIVMGTVARTGIPGFIIGNTAETILGQIDCSVLALKPPGFVTPVKAEG